MPFELENDPQDNERRHYDAHIAQLEERLKAHIEADVQERQALRDSIAKLAESVEGLVQAWRTANGVATFVKWLASVGVAVGVVWAFFSGHWHK